jgi:hypothetical protein
MTDQERLALIAEMQRHIRLLDQAYIDLQIARFELDFLGDE